MHRVRLHCRAMSALIVIGAIVVLVVALAIAKSALSANGRIH